MYRRNPLESIIYKNTTLKEQRDYESVMESNKNASMLDKVTDYLIRAVYDIGSKVLFDSAITKSAGILKDWKHYKTTTDSLKKVSTELGPKYKYYVNTIQTAIVNTESNSKIFNTSFRLKNPMLMYTYSSVVNAISVAVSLLISEVAVNKDTYGAKYKEAAPSNVVVESTVFSSLRNYNNGFKKGEMSKILKTLLDQSKGITKNKPTKESVVVESIVIAGIVGVIVLLLQVRRMLYFLYIQRTKLANYLELQVHYLKQNEVAVKANKEFTPYEKNQIITSQRKWEERLLDLAELVRVSGIDANNKTKIEMDKADKELTLTTMRQVQDHNNDSGEISLL